LRDDGINYSDYVTELVLLLFIKMVHEDPLISAIYADAQTRLREPRHLEQKDSLYMLKHEFGISMMGILFRAGQIGIISQPLQKNYYIQFNKLRWRTEEPSDAYPNEQTFLYKQLVYRALGESYIGGSKAAEFLKMPLSRFHKERKLGVVNASTD
jgi:hypothetical protein